MKRRLFYIIPFLYLIYLSVCAFFTLDTSWDFLAYHLPHSLKIYDLTTYTNGPFLQAVNDGFPPLPHIIQGFFIKITQQFSAANLINILSLFLFVIYCKLTFKLRLSQISLLIVLLLSVPLIHIHTTSGYIDLWSNAFLAIATLEVFEILKRKKNYNLIRLIIFFVSILICLMSKYQLWPAAGFLSFCLLAILVQHKVSLKVVTLSTIVLLLIGLSWPLRNIYLYNNPFYPLKSPVLSSVFSNQKMDTSPNIAQTPKTLFEYPNTIKFLLSSLELTRLDLSQKMNWSIDQYAKGGTSNINHRMGGWNILIGLLWIFIIFQYRKNIVNSWPFITMILIVSILPQSHELRYWLFIPLVLSLLITRMISGIRRKTRQFRLIIAYVLVCFIIVLIDVHPKFRFNSIGEIAPTAARDFWKRADIYKEYRICDLPNEIFYSGPNLNTYKVIGCH